MKREVYELYEVYPKYIYRQLEARKINILQVWSFFDFISGSNSNNSVVESQQIFQQNVSASYS